MRNLEKGRLLFIFQSLAVRDAVRDCLEKEPIERTDSDLDTLLEFTQQLRAFSNMTLAVRKSLCAVMVSLQNYSRKSSLKVFSSVTATGSYYVDVGV